MLKLRLLAHILTGVALTIGAVAVPQTSIAGNNKYFCAQLHGTYRTFARTARGPIPLISWVSYSAPPWTPRARCIAVSKRFERFYDNGNLRYISTGIVNGQPVLCAVRSQGDSCHGANVLVTLPPGTNRYEAAQTLLDLRGLAAGRTLDLSGDERFEKYVDGETYYNLDLILSAAPVSQEQELSVVKE